MILGHFLNSILYPYSLPLPSQIKFNYSSKFISKVQPEELSFGPNQFDVFHQNQSNLESIPQMEASE